jgi:uncharacterized protein (DUF1330 family)
MKYYAVAEIDITDPSWVAGYVAKTTALVERFGGRFLARTPRVGKMEGNRVPPQVFLIVEWPSKEAAETFHESPEYRPHRESRRAGSRADFFLVAGEDVNRPAAMT